MYQTLLVLFLLVAISLITLIMMQQGKVTNIGTSFNTSTYDSLFSSCGSSNFMTRIITTLAILFFIFSLILGNLSSSYNQKGSHYDNLNQVQQISKTQTKISEKLNNDIPQ